MKTMAQRILALTFLLVSAIQADGFAQTSGTVTGVVTEAGSQRPLASAQVYLQSNRIGTTSNNVGRYVLANVPAGSVTIRVELIGYTIAERTVTVPAGGTVVHNVSLQVRAIALDEIVATGTASATEKRKLGNTMAVVDGRKLAEVAPIRDFTEMLQGRSAAVAILPTTGTVGSGASIRIRGITSVTQTNKPLIYIDGVRADDSSLALSVGGVEPSRLTDINPYDIRAHRDRKGRRGHDVVRHCGFERRGADLHEARQDRTCPLDCRRRARGRAAVDRSHARQTLDSVCRSHRVPRA